MAETPIYFVSTLGEAQRIIQSSSHQAQTINDLLDEAAVLRPHHPAVGFPVPNSEEEGWGSEVFSFKELRDGSIAVAAILQDLLKDDVFLSVMSFGIENGEAPCVALLCQSNVDFLFVWLGLIRSGYSVLLIAPQCQPSAIVGLCKDCSASTILYSKLYQELATSAVNSTYQDLLGTILPWQLSKEKVSSLIQQTKPNGTIPSPQGINPNSIAYIHHTSGTSTGLLKPIPQSHHAAVGVLPRLKTNCKATFTTTPLYHGGIADCFRAWSSGELIWLFPGGKLPITERNIISSLKATKIEMKAPVKYFSSVPYILQMLASNDDGLEWLQKMEIVGVGGAALPKEVGDTLVQKGVNLVSRFGSAECGFLLSSYRDFKTDPEWQYLRLRVPSPFLLFEQQDDESGLAELIVLKGWPHMAKKNRKNGSFATGDLFQPHETIKGLWKYHSRSGGQIALTTGKKFDPAPIEDMIVASAEGIKAALIFGAGRQVPGILIFVDGNGDELARDLVWSCVDDANSMVDSHARIDEDMIIIQHYDGQLEKSSKGTVIRRDAEKRFAKEIEEAYQKSKFENLPRWLSREMSAKEKIRAIMNQVLGRSLEDYESFFDNGVDSQRSTRIRALLQGCFFCTKLPWNIVYDCGNTEKLSKYFETLPVLPPLMEPLLGIFEGMGLDVGQGGGNFSKKAQEMLRMVEKFCRSPNTDVFHDGQHVVILTGATGALGAHILQNLLSKQDVSRIYCLVRAATNSEAQERVVRNLEARKIDYVGGLSKLECLASKLHNDKLGLDPNTYSILKDQVTMIIHAAWPVNFLLPLSAFESALQGLSNLLTLNQSAKFLFCSSTASILSDSNSPIPEKISTSPSDSSPTGYAQSKWVAEYLCSQYANPRISIVRIGQLTGDSKHGIWNRSEAYPLMLSSVGEVGCLPAIGDTLDWLPVDLAGKAIVEIAFSALGDRNSVSPDETEEIGVYHVVNKHTKPTFSDLLNWLKDWGRIEGMGDTRLRFEIVEPEIWMDRLETLEIGHPLRSLLGFWRKIYGKKGRGKGKENGCMKEKNGEWMSEKCFCEEVEEEVICRFGTEEAEKVSEVMRNVKAVDREFVGKIWGWLVKDMGGGSVRKCWTLGGRDIEVRYSS